ncbi:MAG: hypothetical protein V3U33_08370 [candidate division NC10 bacterium]
MGSTLGVHPETLLLRPIAGKMVTSEELERACLTPGQTLRRDLFMAYNGKPHRSDRNYYGPQVPKAVHFIAERGG